MEDIVNVEFKEVSERSLPVIASEIKTIEEVVYRTTLEGVIQIGKRLEEAKQRLGHGNFSDWCKSELGYSQRQAQKYIEISQKYSDENSAFSKANISSYLSISKAYSLLALPENEVESFTEIHDVESMTVKELEEEIKKLKEERAKQLDDKVSEIQELRATITELQNSDLEEELKAAQEKLASTEKDKVKLEKEVKKFKGKVEKADKDKEDAVNEAMEEARREATDAMQAEMTELKRRLDNSDPTIIMFKERFDKLQQAVSDIKSLISETENVEQSKKMQAALKAALSQIL